jgi:dynein heavy chain, axonemal
MTATLQLYARKTMTPIDTLKFKTTVYDAFKDDIDIVPETGVNIHGLFLQGARWDMKTKLLVDNLPKELFNELPCFW